MAKTFQLLLGIMSLKTYVKIIEISEIALNMKIYHEEETKNQIPLDHLKDLKHEQI